jgi:hypothetical protein
MNKNSIISFLKVGESWYADLPQYIEQGGTFASCLMVAGAPELIEIMAGNDAKRASFEVNTEWFSGFEAVLNKEGEADVPDEEGSWAKYLTTVYDRTKSVHDTLHSVSLYVGLCPVNKWVFGGHHPNSIYLKFLNAESD